MEHTGLLCGGKGIPVSPLASLPVLLFLGSTGWMAQLLGCAGAGKRELISINPFLTFLCAFTCVFCQEGDEPTPFHVTSTIQKGNSDSHSCWVAQVRQPGSMGKLREVGGYQSPKLRQSLVLKVLASLRFRESLWLRMDFSNQLSIKIPLNLDVL